MATFLTGTDVEGQLKSQPINKSQISSQQEPPVQKQSFLPKIDDNRNETTKSKNVPTLADLTSKSKRMQSNPNKSNTLRASTSQGAIKSSSILKKDDGKNGDASKTQNSFYREKSVGRLREISKYMEEMKKEEKERKLRSENAFKDMGKDPKKENPFDEKPEHEDDIFLRAYEKNIVEKYDELYKTKTEDVINKRIRYLEKNKVFTKQIEQEESKLEGKKKDFNSKVYELKVLEKRIAELQQVDDTLTKKLDDNSNLEALLAIRKEELKAAKMNLSSAESKCESLEHIRERTKADLLKQKKRSIRKEEDINHANTELHSLATRYNNIHSKWLPSALEKANKAEKYHKNIDKNMDPLFESMLEDEVSFFEDKIALREIKKHEEEKKELERQRLENDRMQAQARERADRDKKFSDEARIKEEREAQLIEQETIFNKLRKIAHVPNVQGLIGYYEQLTEKYDELCNSKKESEEEIDELIRKYEESKKKLEDLKFIKMNGLDSPVKKKVNPEEQEQEKLKIYGEDTEYVEITQELGKTKEELEVLEENFGKTTKFLSDILIIVGRMVYQVSRGKRTIKFKDEKKNADVDIEYHLSQLGLVLEKMLTIIVKKRKPFRFESINTDGTYQTPPEFLGLNQKKFNLPIDPREDDLRVDSIPMQDEVKSKDEKFFARIRQELKQLNQELAEGRISNEEFTAKLERVQKEFGGDDGEDEKI